MALNQTLGHRLYLFHYEIEGTEVSQ